MLSAPELAQIRSDCGQLLPDTAYILAVSRSSDGAGGWTDTAGTAGTASCRLDFPKPYGKESVANASLTPYKTATVTLPYDTAITTTNQLSINSVTYNVTGENTGQSWLGIKRVTVERVP